MVARWWRRWPHTNIGIPTGPESCLAVIDLDGPDGAAAWQDLIADHGAVDTATAMTPHGRHHWYRLPDGMLVPRSIRGLGDGVDLLGSDGYAIAPPSTIAICPKHRDADTTCGTTYTWTPRTRHLAPLPAWIPQHLDNRRQIRSDRTGDSTRERPPAAKAQPSRQHRQVRHARRYALAALRGETERVAAAEAGRRNDTLNCAAWRLARHLHDGALTEAEIRNALANAADTCGLTADDGARTVHTTITSALRSGGRSL
jgi:hypothetical protein